MATVGIDVGGTKCLGVALVGGIAVAEARLPTPVGGAAVLETMASLVPALEAEAGEAVVGVGVGVPGLVDCDGVLRFAPNVRGADGLDVRTGLEERLGLPVAVDNDATCAAWGERQIGAARGYDDVVLVALGTGIGGGIVAGGRIQRGANGFAGEIGHIVVDPTGPPCPCGRRGCWERFASGSGLGRLARDVAVAGRAGRVVELAGGDPALVRGEHVGAALAEGDPEAAAVIEEFAWWVALGLADLANIFDPQALVVGGGLVELGPALFEPVRAAFEEQLAGQVRRPAIDIVAAALGEQAGAIGAAFLAEDELVPSSASEAAGDR